MSIFPFPKISMAIKDYLVTLFVKKYVDNIVQEYQEGDVTINALSGKAIFTTVVPATPFTYARVRIQNSFITYDSQLILSLNYDVEHNPGIPSIACFHVDAGTVSIFLQNNSDQATNVALIIQFIIV